MSAYLAQKEERVRAQEAKKAAMEQTKQRPTKMPKLETVNEMQSS